MKTWVVYAMVSMVFAGMTPVVAKMGLTGITGEWGLMLRTLFVCLMVCAFGLITLRTQARPALSSANYFWLGLSALTTTLSWIFYYKSLKDGAVSTISVIDKGSIVVAVLLSTILLKEPLTARLLLGLSFMACGLLIVFKTP